MHNDNYLKAIFEMDEGDLHFPQYDGIVCLRELPPDFWPKRSRLMHTGADIVRLHLELRRDDLDFLDFDDDGHSSTLSRHIETEEETRVLRTYGKVQYGNSISRDILIPSDMPLYALHYMIQQAFGWENSHLHRFELPMKQFLNITDNNAGKWASLVGVLFRSPWMDESDQFWADDYETGSFKTWLRKKYTGPYLSLCHGEGIMQCAWDMEEIRKRIPKVTIEYCETNGKCFISDVNPAEKNAKIGEIHLTKKERESFYGKIVRKETMYFEDCSAEAVLRLFLEGGANNLLERLPVEEVLAFHDKSIHDALAPDEEICSTFGDFADEDLREEVNRVLVSGIDDPVNQPFIKPVTDVIYYFYDYGDNWRIKITGSNDACDLVEQGRVTQADLDRAIQKIHETYRPVCIAADGLPLVDDAGGISGYCRFLRAINPKAEKEYWGKGRMPDNWSYETKQSSLEWAKSLGWKDKVNVKSLL